MRRSEIIENYRIFKIKGNKRIREPLGIGRQLNCMDSTISIIKRRGIKLQISWGYDIGRSSPTIQGRSWQFWVWYLGLRKLRTIILFVCRKIRSHNRFYVGYLCNRRWVSHNVSWYCNKQMPSHALVIIQ